MGSTRLANLNNNGNFSFFKNLINLNYSFWYYYSFFFFLTNLFKFIWVDKGLILKSNINKINLKIKNNIILGDINLILNQSFLIIKLNILNYYNKYYFSNNINNYYFNNKILKKKIIKNNLLKYKFYF